MGRARFARRPPPRPSFTRVAASRSCAPTWKAPASRAGGPGHELRGSARGRSRARTARTSCTGRRRAAQASSAVGTGGHFKAAIPTSRRDAAGQVGARRPRASTSARATAARAAEGCTRASAPASRSRTGAAATSGSSPTPRSARRVAKLDGTRDRARRGDRAARTFRRAARRAPTVRQPHGLVVGVRRRSRCGTGDEGSRPTKARTGHGAGLGRLAPFPGRNARAILGFVQLLSVFGVDMLLDAQLPPIAALRSDGSGEETM